MALSQKHRSSIYQTLSPVIGEEEAEALLSQFPARDLDQPVTQAFVRVELAEFRAEMNEFRTEMRAEMNEFRTEMRAEMNEFRTEMRAEMKRVALRDARSGDSADRADASADHLVHGRARIRHGSGGGHRGRPRLIRPRFPLRGGSVRRGGTGRCRSVVARGEAAPTAGHRAQVDGVAQHLGGRHEGRDGLLAVADRLGALHPAPAGVEVAHHVALVARSARRSRPAETARAAPASASAIACLQSRVGRPS